MKKPTASQIRFALALLQKRGYPMRYMDASFKKLGATPEECFNGLTGEWIHSLNRTRLSKLITTLQDIQTIADKSYRQRLLSQAGFSHERMKVIMGDVE